MHDGVFPGAIEVSLGIGGDDYLLQTAYEHCLDLVRYHNPDIVYFELTDQEVKAVPYSYTEPVIGSTFLHNNNLRGSACSYIFKQDILHEQRFTFLGIIPKKVKLFIGINKSRSEYKGTDIMLKAAQAIAKKYPELPSCYAFSDIGK